jgi:F-type H+-transporting ATPase subunit gamma
VPTLRDIRRRIRSVESTQKITRAMQMVAAAKFNRAQKDVRALRPYAEAVEGLMAQFLQVGAAGDHPLLERETVRRRALVVVASDRGLCGSYNTTVFRSAQEYLRSPSAGDTAVIPLGRRAGDFFRKASVTVLYEHRTLGDRYSPAMAKGLAWQLGRLYSSGEVDRVDVLYTRFVSTLKREITVQPMLGLPRGGEGGTGTPYLIEPSPEVFRTDLLPRVLVTRMMAVLAEVFASEHSARMVAMRSATDNATDLIEQLTLVRNRMRQSAITKELADIVGSAEAMK